MPLYFLPPISRVVSLKKFSLEFFPCRYNKNEPVWQKICRDVTGISRQTHAGRVKGDPPGYPEARLARYLVEAEDAWMAIASEGDEAVGFGAVKRVSTSAASALYIILSLVVPKYQGQGISTFILASLVYDYLLRHDLDETFLIVESPNPAVVGKMTSILIDVYPNPRQRSQEPKADVFGLAMAFANDHYQGHVFDNTVFVVRDWYLDSPQLLYKAAGAPLYGDKVINAFCAENLRYAEERGDKLLMVGRANKKLAKNILGLFSQ